MILSFTLTTGGSIGLDRDSIWKVDGTGYGAIISVGTDTYMVTDSFDEVIAASAGALIEVVSNGNTIALNLGVIQRVYEDSSGNAVLILKNGDKYVVGLTLAEVVALQNSGFGDIVFEKIGTIVGTDETPITLYEGVGTDAHLFLIKVLFKCTSSGNGTTVVDEGTVVFSAVSVRNGALATWNDIYEDADDTSMPGYNWNVDIDSGDLRYLITPPNTAGSTTVFSYKIRFSRITL